MTLLYRAIWHDDDASIQWIIKIFSEWVVQKTKEAIFLDPSRDDVQTLESQSFSCRLERATAASSGAAVQSAVRGSLTERRLDGSRWTTRLKVWSGPGCQEEDGAPTWIWVDVEAVTYETFPRIVIGAPRFVRVLISNGTRPGKGPVSLTSSPVAFRGTLGAEALAHVLENPDRDLPFIIFSHPRARQNTNNRIETIGQAMVLTGHQVAGVGQIGWIDRSAAEHFRTIVGDNLYVDNGAFRIYLPGVDPALDQGWRHRYVRLDEYGDNIRTPSRIVSRKIAPASTTRRAPETWDQAARLIESFQSRTVEEDRELLELYASENESQQREIAELQEQLNELFDEHANLQSERTALRERLRTAEANLLAVMSSGGGRRRPDALNTPAIRLPTRVYYPSQAATYARDLLSDYLDIPETALVDLEDLDAALQRKAWGQTSWEGFLALHAFAKDVSAGEDVGSFWVWCQKSGNPFAWRATEKKLAMVESQTVMNSDRLRAKRVFPVDDRVDPSGRVLMTSHLKIAEGGGNLAPRIYFMYSGKTGKSHVGYFGPHKNVPNTLA
jgi:hypothetical protein